MPHGNVGLGCPTEQVFRKSLEMDSRMNGIKHMSQSHIRKPSGTHSFAVLSGKHSDYSCSSRMGLLFFVF